MREGTAHKVKDILDKTLKRRHQLYNAFDHKTLSCAKEALRLIIHERGLSDQLTRSSPAVYDFPKAWMELTASMEPSQQPLTNLKADGTGDLNDVVRDTSFWSTVRWFALDTSRSMRPLALTLKDSQLHKMASPLHIKKNGRPEVGVQLSSSSTETPKTPKTRHSADAQVISEAKAILGKRSASQADIKSNIYPIKRCSTSNI